MKNISNTTENKPSPNLVGSPNIDSQSSKNYITTMYYYLLNSVHN